MSIFYRGGIPYTDMWSDGSNTDDISWEARRIGDLHEQAFFRHAFEQFGLQTYLLEKPESKEIILKKHRVTYCCPFCFRVLEFYLFPFREHECKCGRFKVTISP